MLFELRESPEIRHAAAFITATRIGDAVLSLGLLHHLLAQHSGARVTIACGAPAAALFEATPGLEDLIVVRKKPFSLHWLALWGSVCGRRWDLVVDLRASALAYFLSARRRLVSGSANQERASGS